MTSVDRLVLDLESRWGSSYATHDAKVAQARAEGLEPHEYALILRGSSTTRWPRSTRPR